MSVINQMLKDLESRQQQYQVTNLDNLSPVSLLKPPQRRLLWLLTLVSILAAVMTGAYLWPEMVRSLPGEQKPETGLVQTQVQAHSQVQAEPQPQSQTESKVIPQIEAKSSAVARGSQTTTTYAKVKATAAGKEPVINEAPVVRTGHQHQNNNVTDMLVKPGSMAVTPLLMSNTELAQTRFELGVKAEQNGNFDQALLEYLKALEFNPALHIAREHLAAVYYGKGLMASAAQTLLQGIDVFPDYQHYRLLLARVYQATGQLQAAYDNAAVMQVSGAEAIEKWALLGDLAEALNRYDLAQNAYNQLLTLRPGSGRWLMARAYTIDLQGNYEEAMREYKQALASAGLSDSAVAFIQQRLSQLGALQ
ncbi:MAG: tetratricopeptide repeat protein [Shewanella sp.]|nr:tetratricopeptide repeat protein [Shewanella sp.]